MTLSSNHKPLLIILGLVLTAIISLTIFWSNHNNSTNSNPDSSASAPPKISGRPLGITITDPDLKAKITSPVLIAGSASADNFINNQINFQVVDSNNQVLGRGSANRGSAQDNNYFSFETKLDFKAGQSGLGFIIINDNPNFKFPIQIN